MLVDIDSVGLINIDELSYMTIQYTPDITKVEKSRKLFGFLVEYEDKITDKWTLSMKYSHGKEKYTYSFSSTSFKELINAFKSVKKQIEEGGVKYLDKAFEEGILK